MRTLAINCGSSSLKFALMECSKTTVGLVNKELASGGASGIGNEMDFQYGEQDEVSRRFDETACPTGPEISFEDAWRFIIKVGVAAQKYGCTAIRLEAFLTSLSTSLGFSGVFRVTPSGIFFALREGPRLPQRIELVDTPIPGLDLHKVARLGDLLDEIKAGALSFADASPRLDAVDREPHPPTYDVSMYVVQDRGETECKTHVMRSTYYAVGIPQLVELMAEAGFVDVKRLDGRFFQPMATQIVIANGSTRRLMAALRRRI